MPLENFDWNAYETRRAKRIADNSKYFESTCARLVNDSVATLNAGISEMIRINAPVQTDWVEQVENDG